MCKSLVWDSDNEEPWLERIEDVIRGPYHLVRDGVIPGRTGHLRLLLDKPIPAAAAIRFAREIHGHAGVPKDAIEFFPKQTKAVKAATAHKSAIRDSQKAGR